MEDVRKLVANVEKNFRLDCDMTKQKASSLILHQTLSLTWETQFLVRILCWKTPGLGAGEVLKNAKRISEALTVKDLEEIYSLYPAKEPLQFLVLLKCWRSAIRAEVNRRFGEYKVGRELFAFQARLRMKTLNDSWILPLLKVLKVEKVKTKRPDLEDTQDLLLLAVEKAMEIHQELSAEKQVKEFLIPLLPPNFLGVPEEPQYLRDRISVAMGRNLVESMKFFLPLLEGELEKTPETVRQELREHYRKRKRQAKIRAESALEIEENIHPTNREDNVTKIDLHLAYQFAQKRWKEKGRVFLKALVEQGKTVTEASSEAGISRQMGHRYRKEIKKALSPEDKES